MPRTFGTAASLLCRLRPYARRPGTLATRHTRRAFAGRRMILLAERLEDRCVLSGASGV
jgi:hypothetical protein